MGKYADTVKPAVRAPGDATPLGGVVKTPADEIEALLVTAVRAYRKLVFKRAKGTRAEMARWDARADAFAEALALVTAGSSYIDGGAAHRVRMSVEADLYEAEKAAGEHA